ELTSLAKRSSPSWVERSAATDTHSPILLSSSSAAWTCSALRAVMYTRATPASRNPRAIISPTPRDPPVTTAVLPLMENRSSAPMRGRMLVRDAEPDELAVLLQVPPDVGAALELGLDQRLEGSGRLGVAPVGGGEPALLVDPL